MICSKCEVGTVNKILFKKDNKNGFLCDYCGTVWFEGETISMTTGHVMQSVTKDAEMDYTFIDNDSNNEDMKSVMYPKFK